MIEIFADIEQNTPEWHAVRAGVITASEFSTVMASGKGGGDSKVRRTYMLKLAGEILTGAPAESYSNQHMERGHEHEAQARLDYEFLQDVQVQQVGFIKNFGVGYSPDGLVGTDGLVEFKSQVPHLLIDRLLRDTFPPEHKAQCQGGLWVSEREWIDINVSWPGLPKFTKRAYRDEAYIIDIIAAVKRFRDELDEVVEQIRAMGGVAVAA